MATTFNWAAFASRGTVLTTELDALANAAYSAVGTEIDNGTNLDQWGVLDIVLASLNPTAGAFLQLFISKAVGGTTYEDPPSATNPGYQMTERGLVIPVPTGSAAKRVQSGLFRLPPCKFKLVLLNKTAVTLGATTNTVTLYTTNEKGN